MTTNFTQLLANEIEDAEMRSTEGFGMQTAHGQLFQCWRKAMVHIHNRGLRGPNAVSFMVGTTLQTIDRDHDWGNEARHLDEDQMPF